MKKGKTARAKSVKPRNIITDVAAQLNANFQYGAVEYEYNTDHSDCNPGDYHRCCRIDNFNVVSVDTDRIINDIVSCFDDEHDRCRITRLLKNDPILANTDNYEADIQGSYYGEDVHSVRLDSGCQAELLAKICAIIEKKQS